MEPPPEDENALLSNRSQQMLVNIPFIITIAFAFVLIASIILLMKFFFDSSPAENPPSTWSNSLSRRDELIAAFPVFIHGKLPANSDYGITSSSSNLSAFENENCAICLEEYEHGEAIRVLPRCKHMFHKDCIEQWLRLRSMNCPVCRDKTIEDEMVPASSNCRHGIDGQEIGFLDLGFRNHL